jgi:hypothetical protein
VGWQLGSLIHDLALIRNKRRMPQQALLTARPNRPSKVPATPAQIHTHHLQFDVWKEHTHPEEGDLGSQWG